MAHEPNDDRRVGDGDDVLLAAVMLHDAAIACGEHASAIELWPR